MKMIFCSLAAAVVLTGAAQAQNATTTPAIEGKNVVGISAQDGITISDTGALVTRNGVTQKMTSEMTLPNGMKVMPDGTVTGTDGTKMILRPDQLLTFDGKLMTNSPARPAATPMPAK